MHLETVQETFLGDHCDAYDASQSHGIEGAHFENVLALCTSSCSFPELSKTPWYKKTWTPIACSRTLLVSPIMISLR